MTLVRDCVRQAFLALEQVEMDYEGDTVDDAGRRFVKVRRLAYVPQRFAFRSRNNQAPR